MSEPECALCGQPIEAWDNVVFRGDDRVVHVGCEHSRKPLARLVPAAEPDPLCPVCSQPIRPADSAAREGVDIVHIKCLGGQHRWIAGGSAADPWTLVGDWHFGRHLGRTPVGHIDFMAACAEALTASVRTRRLAADARRGRRAAA